MKSSVSERVGTDHYIVLEFAKKKIIVSDRISQGSY